MSGDPVDLEAFRKRAKGRKPKADNAAQPPPAPPGDGDGGGGAEPGSRIGIKLDEAHVNNIARQCAGLLADEIFLRGTMPVVMVHAEEAGAAKPAPGGDPERGVTLGGVWHARGAPVLVEPTPSRVQFRLDEKALFKRYDQRTDEWRPRSCPLPLAQRVIAAGVELGFRPIAGIVSTPLFVDGNIISARGYHAATGLYLAYAGRLPTIPKRPTKAQAMAAFEVMMGWCRGYTRSLSGDELLRLRVGLGAANLTAVMRPSLARAPAILLDANSPGAGKGKAGRALGMINGGRAPAIVPEGFSPDEFEKGVATALLSGASVIMFDNLHRPLASSTLESGLTEGLATIRVFGSLTSINVPVTALIIFTANNMTMRADMLRRMLTVRIIVKTERPENEVFDFDPYREAGECRDAIIGAALTIVRAWWCVRDTPEGLAIRRRTLGSFEQWSDLVAGAIEWLLGSSPIELIEQRKSEDPRLGDERQVFAALARWQFTLTPPMGRKLATWTAKQAASGLSAEIWAGVIRIKGETPAPREVADWLKRRRDRIFSVPQSVDGNETHDSFATWQLVGRPGRTGVMEWQLHSLQTLEYSASIPHENLAGPRYKNINLGDRDVLNSTSGEKQTMPESADHAPETFI